MTHQTGNEINILNPFVKPRWLAMGCEFVQDDDGKTVHPKFARSDSWQGRRTVLRAVGQTERDQNGNGNKLLTPRPLLTLFRIC